MTYNITNATLASVFLTIGSYLIGLSFGWVDLTYLLSFTG